MAHQSQSAEPACTGRVWASAWSSGSRGLPGRTWMGRPEYEAASDAGNGVACMDDG